MRLTDDDVVCNTPPLFHCFDKSTLASWPWVMLILMLARLVLGNLTAWCHGSAVVYASEIYDPRAIVGALTKERCTVLHGVPTHFLGVLAEVERRKQAGERLDFSRLRFVSFD
jgi:acyl-CoA synthetase (AMP-forming)/AMP-acid ligase II